MNTIKTQLEWKDLNLIFEELLQRDIPSSTALNQWLIDVSHLEAELEEDYAWRYIRMTCDTTDPKLLEDFQFFATQIAPKVALESHKLHEKFAQNPFLKELDQNKYYVYIRKVKKEIELFREENIPLQTQLQVEQQKYQSIVGSMTVTINEEEHTLERASIFIRDLNRTIRQGAWEAISKRRLQEKDKLNGLFNKLLKLRHEIAKNAGFENFRDYSFQALGRFDYTPQDCYKFHQAIQEEVVPLLVEQAKERQQLLGLERLKPWDMDVDASGEQALKPFVDGKDLIEKTWACFNAIHPYLGQCIDTMSKNNLFDIESRPGKAPGGYNYPLSKSGVPFIFMNAVSSVSDLRVMMHEGGHAIHTFLKAELELNSFKHAPSEIEELASMSMELISMDHWNVFFDNENDLKRAKREQLKDVLKVLPWVAVIDQFQHWIYTNPNHTSKERTEAWKKIYESFGKGFVDWSGLDEVFGNLWQKQLHIFEVPFYYIEYGLAQLGALAIWKKYKEDKHAGLENYLAALKLGYTKTIPETYAAAGIQFDFSATYVRELMQFVKAELQELEKTADE